MKKILILLFVLTVSFASVRAIDITRVEKVQPTDEMFMDMAVTAAKKSVASNSVPSGAVIILNGAWRATGSPENGKTAEEVAVSKSRLAKLTNATVYTVNEPSTATVNMLNSLGVTAIYFAIPRDVVVAAGIYPASAYDDGALATDVKQAPMYLLPFAEAEALVKK